MTGRSSAGTRNFASAAIEIPRNAIVARPAGKSLSGDGPMKPHSRMPLGGPIWSGVAGGGSALGMGLHSAQRAIAERNTRRLLSTAQECE